MNWYIIDKDYINYLKSFDNKVGDVDYGEHIKLYIGIVIEINSCNYYIPISSVKSKHYSMSDKIDFMKVIAAGGRLLAVLNINNMIPVPDDCLTQIKYDNINQFRTFDNETEETNYIYLLQQEKAFIDSHSAQIISNAKKLYDKYIENPCSSLSARCCNFPLLEEKLKKYIN